MDRCEVCGNDYDKTITVQRAGESTSHVFDCFECATHMLAPTCATCGVRILGHGLEAQGTYFCCSHCAEKQGETDLVDRI